jgi:hypothetical protein
VTSGAEPENRIEAEEGRTTATGQLAHFPAIALSKSLRLTCDKLISHFKHDIDIEWAWLSGACFILQVRPITVAPWGPS